MHPAFEVRVALASSACAAMAEFCVAALGMEPSEHWEHEGSHGVLFGGGAGSLELFEDRYARYIDEIEVGGSPRGGLVRLALRVPDLDAAMQRLLDAGHSPLGPAVDTPWGDRNARYQSPDGIQVTVFESRDAAGETPA